MEIVILYRDMRTYGLLEDYYTTARNEGVLFCRYEADQPPSDIEGGELNVSYMDHVLRRPFKMNVDAVVLSAATVAEDTEELASF